MGDALVFEVLDKVDGKKAFADTAFAVEDEVETFHVVCGLSIRTCAMRGPRTRGCWFSPWFPVVGRTGDVVKEERGSLSDKLETGGRLRGRRLLGRDISPKTS